VIDLGTDVGAELLDELRADVVASRTEGFTRVLSGKMSTNEAYDRVRVRRTGR